MAISFLSSGSGSRKPVITTGPRVSYADVQVGIPCVLLTVEMAIFAVAHLFAFPWKPYDISQSPDPVSHYRGGPMGTMALLDAFNPWDIIKAGARGFRWLFVGIRNREQDSSYAVHSSAASSKLHGLDSDLESSGPGIPVPGTYGPMRGGLGLQESGVELRGPPKRRPRQEDEFGDRSALLAQPQSMPRLGIGHSDSGSSSPYHTVDEPPSPGLAPMSPDYPLQYQPQYRYVAGDDTTAYAPSSTVYTPPSPMEDHSLAHARSRPPPGQWPADGRGYRPPTRPDGHF